MAYEDDGIIIMQRPQSMIELYIALKSTLTSKGDGEAAVEDPRAEFKLAIRRVVMGIGLLGSIRDTLHDVQIFPANSEEVLNFSKRLSQITVPKVTPTIEDQYTEITIDGAETPWRVLRGTEATMYPLMYTQLYDGPLLNLAAIEAEIDNILYDYEILHPTENVETSGWKRMVDEGIDMSLELANISNRIAENLTINEDEVTEGIRDSIQKMVDTAVKKALAGKGKK